MTDLEILRVIRDYVYDGIISRPVSGGAPHPHLECLGYCDGEIERLNDSTAEQPKAETPMDVAVLAARLEALSNRLARLRLDYYDHQHLSPDGTTTGTPFTPSRE